MGTNTRSGAALQVSIVAAKVVAVVVAVIAAASVDVSAAARENIFSIRNSLSLLNDIWKLAATNLDLNCIRNFSN